MLGYHLCTPATDDSEVDVYGWGAWDFVPHQVIGQNIPIFFGTLTHLGSAAAIGADGIIVGTTQAIPVPEPIAAALLACLALAGSLQRRC